MDIAWSRIDYDVIIQRLHEVIDARKVLTAELINMENVDAADVNKEIGSSPDNPYRVEGMEITDGVMGARIVIYAYYLQHLNFVGHTSSEVFFIWKTELKSGMHIICFYRWLMTMESS